MKGVCGAVAAQGLRLELPVPGCGLGYVAQEGGTACDRCSVNVFSLWQDPRVANTTAHPSASMAAAAAATAFPPCQPCPANALCAGGAEHVPEAGRWHSAPGSTQMHACPKGDACRSGNDAAQARLASCQAAWYATRVPGEAVVGSPLVRAALATLGNTSTTLAKLGSDTGAALQVLAAAAAGLNVSALGPDAPCLLAGVPPGHPLSYSAALCVPPYAGTLCATCAPGHALDAEFECR